MRATLPIASLLVAAALAAPAHANGQDCHAEASAAAYSGGKSGYAISYDAAYQACASRQHTYAAPKTNRRRNPVIHVQGPEDGCYPGAPRMYKGTLYCFD